MSYIDAIKNRHSVRNYRPDRIEDSKVQKIREMIEKAVLSPNFGTPCLLPLQ